MINGIHMGRAWAGHGIEDACPCVQAPCGLVISGQRDPACLQHTSDKSFRQEHSENECPATESGISPEELAVFAARRAVHESLVHLPAWEADRVRSLVAELESRVTAYVMSRTNGESA